MNRQTVSARSLLVVVGMAREARVARGPGSDVLLSGGNAKRLGTSLAETSHHDYRAVLSLGIAGGLESALRPGDVVVASAVICASGMLPADLRLANDITARLKEAGLSAGLGTIAGSDIPLTSAAAKAELFADTGALAVDMESHVAAAWAAQRGIPFMAVRVVCDPAERSLPQFAVQALRPDGTSDIGLVLRGLVKNPALLPKMIRLGRDANAAFATLRRVGDALGVGRGSPDLVELLRDVS